MSRPERHGARYSFAQYLVVEREGPTKHEYLDGVIYAMAGGTPAHAALAARAVEMLGSWRARGCTTFTSDLAIRVPATGLATYPDVTVVCGPWETDPESANHVTNPTLLVEVTSPSSEEYDLGEKREHYLTIASLSAYLVVSHRAPRLELWRRGADGGWQHTLAEEGEVVSLPGDAVPFAIRQLYGGIPLTGS